MVPAGLKQGVHIRLPTLLGALLVARVTAEQTVCSTELETYTTCYFGGHPPNTSCPYETQLMKLYSGVFPIIRTGESNAPDATASFGAYGMNSFKAFGDFEKCRSLQTAEWCVLAVGQDIGDLDLTGWMSNMNGQNLIQLGACVPSACSEKELSDKIASLLPIVGQFIGPGWDAKVHCGESRHDFDWKAAIMLGVCVFFGCLSAAGTIIEEYERGLRLGTPEERASAEPLLQPLMSDEEGIAAQADAKRLRMPVPLKKLLLHFAMRRNWDLLCALRKGSNTFGCLDGIRVLSMGWVVFGHVLVYSLGLGVANLEVLYPPDGKLATDASTQILASAFFSVDTFFWLSGFLTTYSLLKRTMANDALQGKAFFTKLYPLSIVARWLRLTPIYAFVMAFYGLLQPTFSGGPGWQSCRQNWGSKCDTDWFANLLYFNQFYPKWDENIRCMGHTWYLANDMMFTVLAPLLIFVYIKNKRLGWVVQGLLIGASVAYNFVIFWKFHLFPSTLFGGRDYSAYIYYTPQARIHVYLIGMCYAYLWQHMCNDPQLMRRINQVGELVLHGCMVLMAVLVFITKEAFDCPDFTCTSRIWSRPENMWYGSLSRPAWGVALGGMCIMLFSGHGAYVNAFLSWTAWQPAGKVSYVGYLVHPGVLLTYFCSQCRMVEYSDGWYASSYTFTCVWTFGVALLFYLFVEQPLANLLGGLIHRSG